MTWHKMWSDRARVQKHNLKESHLAREVLQVSPPVIKGLAGANRQLSLVPARASLRSSLLRLISSSLPTTTSSSFFIYL